MPSDTNTTARRPPGRPSTIAAERERRFALRLTTDEHRQLRLRSIEAGRPMHTLVLEALGFEQAPS